MKKWIGAMAIVLLLASTACKKTDNSSQILCTPSVENIAGKYYWTLMTLTKPDGSIVNLQDCMLDDTIILKVNKTFDMQDKPNYCSPSTQKDGTWDVQNGKFIQDGFDWTIDALNCEKGTIKFHRDNTPTAGYKTTFGAQKKF